MFTGIVTDIGVVQSVTASGDTRFVIGTSYAPDTIAIGASIACSGVCLTVIEKAQGWFAVQASGETLGLTTAGGWRVDTRLNLERSLVLGDELGGHIVSGHVDGQAEIVSITQEGDSRRFVFDAPKELARFVASKGSVALDGTSLTVNEVEGTRFGVNLIPHTLEVTIWGAAEVGQAVNMEIDVLARYVARLNETRDWEKK